MELLFRGSTGDQVRLIQERLTNLGYSVGLIDGVFGRQTEDAVMQFQENNDLEVDGRVGPATWEVLFPGDGSDRPEPVRLKGFERATAFTLSALIEGGYANDPDDPGGETNFGISKRAHPGVDIRNLTREKALSIYKRDYWDSIEGDSISEISDDIAMILFDISVNHGPGDAKAFLADSLRDQYGVTGPRQWDTLLGELRQVVEKQPDTDELEFRMIMRRLIDYDQIMEKRSASRKYARGWLKRALYLFREID